MNLNNISKNLLKSLFTLEHREKASFTLGEVVKGEILEKAEKWLLVNLGEKGIVKAFSDVELTNKEIFLKVISTKPEVVLKLYNNAENDTLNFTQELSNNDVAEKIKEYFPDLKDKIFINEKDMKNPLNLKHKIIKLPENLGFDLEKSILEEDINKGSLKFKALESPNASSHDILNFINHNQKINNEFQLVVPLFFQDAQIKKGCIVFKKKEKIKKDKQPFSIVILLDLSNNRKLQVNLTALNKELSISFLSDNSNFIRMLNKNFKMLHDALIANGFKILSYNFKVTSQLDNNEELMNLILENNYLNIVDIKT